MIAARKLRGLEDPRSAERAIVEHEAVAAPDDPLGQSVHLDHRAIGVDDDDASGDLVERASQDSGFPSELAEPELNLGRPAKRLQQLIQTLEVAREEAAFRQFPRERQK